jgi:hypothetical protein
VADAHKNAEIAWAAGLFEGEGCITPSDSLGKPRVQITLGTTDRDVLERFVRIVHPEGNIRQQKTHSVDHRPFFVWSTSGHKAVPIIARLLPWLGERRQEKAIEALEAATRLRPRHGTETHCPRGHSYDAENTRWTGSNRHCRACEREGSRRRRLRVIAHG